ncbi:hypothetical protein [Noviherbaspirillum denitrificans]|uniref:Uncharacterized protein n=1 Tax=Noviherbaspirillum denitrificans TaxID=1968433 RepID=A0A254T6J4_9BURK|nr:hypothetical protein [Noviherbaspirillum denitrificans]OWW18289.1 hypothetical protein AYR66_02185 [Noviherbaspirillum denitrificans]
MNKHFPTMSSEDANLQQFQENMCEQKRRDASLDEALGFTFPASDPVALNCEVTVFLAPGREQRITIDL